MSKIPQEIQAQLEEVVAKFNKKTSMQFVLDEQTIGDWNSNYVYYSIREDFEVDGYKEVFVEAGGSIRNSKVKDPCLFYLKVVRHDDSKNSFSMNLENVDREKIQQFIKSEYFTKQLDELSNLGEMYSILSRKINRMEAYGYEDFVDKIRFQGYKELLTEDL